MSEHLNVIPLIVGAYLINAFVTYMLASKAGLSEKWIAFIPFGANHLKVVLADLNEIVFTPISILYSSLTLFFVYFSSPSLIPVPVLMTIGLLVVPMVYIHWKLLEAFLLPGILSTMFVFPYFGSIVYLVVIAICGVRVSQFYVGND